MAKNLLKMFIILMALGLVAPLSAMIDSKVMDDETEEAEDLDLKSLEDELRRLLEESEKEVVSIPSSEGDVEEKLEIKYTEPMTDAFKQELKAQPKDTKEEIILLDSNDEDLDVDEDGEDFEDDEFDE